MFVTSSGASSPLLVKPARRCDSERDFVHQRAGRVLRDVRDVTPDFVGPEWAGLSRSSGGEMLAQRKETVEGQYLSSVEFDLYWRRTAIVLSPGIGDLRDSFGRKRTSARQTAASGRYRGLRGP